MRPPRIALALGGTALGGLLLLAGNVLQGTGEQATASIAAPVSDAGAEITGSGESARPPPVRARPVQPALIAPPPLDPSELERAEPRPPLGDIALALPPKPGLPERRLLYRPVAVAAGRLEVQGHSIALDGIAAVEPDEECLSANGASWPCGRVARTAFRNWLRGRAVECTVGEPPANQPVVSACSLGTKDVALWLVENGLATAEPGGAYVEAGDKAKAERRGIFGQAPGIAE